MVGPRNEDEQARVERIAREQGMSVEDVKRTESEASLREENAKKKDAEQNKEDKGDTRPSQNQR